MEPRKSRCACCVNRKGAGFARRTSRHSSFQSAIKREKERAGERLRFDYALVISGYPREGFRRYSSKAAHKRRIAKCLHAPVYFGTQASSKNSSPQIVFRSQ